MFRREGKQRRLNLPGPEPMWPSDELDRSVHVPLSRGTHFIMWNFPLFPDQASTMARQVDALYFFELGVAAFFTALICIFIVTFAARYRQKSNVDRSNPPTASKLMEVLWIGVPLALGMVMFVWGANVFFRIYEPARECARDRRGRQAVDVVRAAC